MYECFLQAYHLTRDEYFSEADPVYFRNEIEGNGDGDPEDYTTGALKEHLCP